VHWSVAETEMATIDHAAGILTVLPNAKGRLHLRGTVTGSARPVEGEIIVIGEDVAPLLGAWKEEASLDCLTHLWITPSVPIVLFKLRAEGGFEMASTWHDFQSDYYGKFTYNRETARMTLEVTEGKYPPLEARKQGTARIERGALVLDGIWLGSTRFAGEPVACGHRFVRLHP
jgi:hypothetical protein